VNPVDVGRDACDDPLCAVFVSKTDGTDHCPLVLIVLADEWTSAVTLGTTQT